LEKEFNDLANFFVAYASCSKSWIKVRVLYMQLVIAPQQELFHQQIFRLSQLRQTLARRSHEWLYLMTLALDKRRRLFFI
jgi:hypothetical protein